MTTETYPHTISGPPAWVNGYRVLAWAEKAYQNGYYPGGVILAVKTERDDMEYVTSTAYTTDGGLSWAWDNGRYTHDHDDAWQAFASKCRNLAQA